MGKTPSAGESLASTQNPGVSTYNHYIPRRTLSHTSPVEALAQQPQDAAELFVSEVDNPMEDHSNDIEFAFTLKPDPDPEMGQYVLAFEGHATAWDDAVGDDRPVGHIRGHRIDLVSALHDGLRQDALLESLTPEIADFAQAVLSDGRCLLPAAALSGLAAEECDCVAYIAELLGRARVPRGRGRHHPAAPPRSHNRPFALPDRPQGPAAA